MATPISLAQEVITCDLCDTPTQQFCNRCQVSLCAGCVSKHVDKHRPHTHVIVPFKNRKTEHVFTECEFHPYHRCEGHCQQCDVTVCMKCVITSHNGHIVGDIPKNFNDKKKNIQRENHEIESNIIPSYMKKNENIEKDKELAMKKFDEVEKEIKRHRKLWHQEVGSIFNKLRSLLKSMRDNQLAVLKTHQTKLKNLIPDMIKTVQENKEILKSNKVAKITNFKSRLMEYRNIGLDIYVSVPALQTNTVQGRELSIELGEYKATLTQSSDSSLSNLTDEVSYLSARELLDRARIITTFPIAVKPLYRLACSGSDKAWVSGENNTVDCLDINGSILETVSCKTHPEDISVTKNGELIYSDYENKTVDIVKHGKTEVLITTQKDWNPARLTSTKSGDILVSLYNGDQNKIVRYQGQKVKQEIFKDENEKLIYGGGKWTLFVAENNNEDICVSDRNGDAVVVVDKTRRVRFRYDSTPAIGKKKFDPNQLVTDSLSQIIVADWTNDCLHILDQDGEFLRCVDNCELSRPLGLILDSDERLWVGLYEKGEVKVIQYMK
ncbi:uncharacterized protein LOC133194883 [Saccostrea echinata]|uniref:uncharacterized protein LOC133194883 n=1 Tax=Saccostrea echinata TaxID=191078 RepID=UPI002A817DC6|nr:uncharacterized protein LOC133194883 [Saccostrea echinata]